MNIQWYPGHIAKAERQLQEQLKYADVVFEVRDARIPLATFHPRLLEWVGDRARLLVVNRTDEISASARDRWETWFRDRGERPYFTNARDGKGVVQVARAARASGDRVNEKRRKRGLQPRAVRAAVIGFPNIGKSALINRLLNRRAVKSARRPGVTRRLQWVRLSDRLELLDAPGVIPSQLPDRLQALKLAICDDIGEAAYDTQLVAAAFVDRLCQLDARHADRPPAVLLEERYQLSTAELTGESYLHQLAAARFQTDVERAARSLLDDFRQGRLGKICLELPPESPPESLPASSSELPAPDEPRAPKGNEDGDRQPI